MFFIDEKMNNEQSTSFDNLILACDDHHKDIEWKKKKYLVKILKEIKQEATEHSVDSVDFHFSEDIRTLIFISRYSP